MGRSEALRGKGPWPNFVPRPREPVDAILRCTTSQTIIQSWDSSAVPTAIRKLAAETGSDRSMLGEKVFAFTCRFSPVQRFGLLVLLVSGGPGSVWSWLFSGFGYFMGGVKTKVAGALSAQGP